MNNPIEIERRFLLGVEPDQQVLETQDDCYVIHYTHGFLPGERIRERVTVGSIAPTYKRTVKVGSGEQRYEFEEPITKDLFDWFWPMTEGRRISATRWCVRDLGLTSWFTRHTGVTPPRKLKYEVTLIHHPELWLVEIETPAVCVEVVPFPSWLQVLREVTEDVRYETFNLATAGTPR